MKHYYLYLTVILASASSLASNESLWNALSTVGRERVAADILNREFEAIDPNWAPAHSPGETIFWVAAAGLQFNIVERLLAKRDLNVNATPLSGPHAGKTAFWFTAVFRRYQLMGTIMFKFDDVDVYASPREGKMAGMDAVDIVEDALWDAQVFQDVELIQRLQLLHQRLLLSYGYGHPRVTAGTFGQQVRRQLIIAPTKTVLEALKEVLNMRALREQMGLL